MRRRVIEIQLDGYASWVRGYGSRELVMEVVPVGKAPVWLPSVRAWCVQQHTARDVIAACERRGFDLEVTGPRAAGIRDLTSADVAEPEPVIEPEAGLW
ncbi:MAG: hypothetical protein CMH83_20035 [Nocardioides sp.]|nr:hypothetical protein [Nocardioides sp.]